jgi:valyl-tRNA synthetase
MEKLTRIVEEVTNHLQQRKLGLAADVLYNEFWHWFCDECIEKQKQGKISLEMLKEGLLTFLKMLHPFMPFVTEKIWQEIRQEIVDSPTLLITSQWPKNS